MTFHSECGSLSSTWYTRDTTRMVPGDRIRTSAFRCAIHLLWYACIPEQCWGLGALFQRKIASKANRLEVTSPGISITEYSVCELLKFGHRDAKIGVCNKWGLQMQQKSICRCVIKFVNLMRDFHSSKKVSWKSDSLLPRNSIQSNAI